MKWCLAMARDEAPRQQLGSAPARSARLAVILRCSRRIPLKRCVAIALELRSADRHHPVSGVAERCPVRGLAANASDEVGDDRRVRLALNDDALEVLVAAGAGTPAALRASSPRVDEGQGAGIGRLMPKELPRNTRWKSLKR